MRQRRARRAELRPSGTHHDLGPLFDRLNRGYFENTLAQPAPGLERAQPGERSSAASIRRSIKL